MMLKTTTAVRYRGREKSLEGRMRSAGRSLAMPCLVSEMKKILEENSHCINLIITSVV